ncbi:MAG: glutamine--fructose-6-phosphate transaminase (isomerizing), partial [Candidatus Poribacteria bacterium]|nr:glutamine--fructose-6-phosphate transaminase (isomerizing) [Candidatus Poribacteria bacterium]
MCGIIGYIGKRQATDILVDGLRRLEYRGYDSAGLAVLNNAELLFQKSQGKLERLVNQLQSDLCIGKVGIGHTRWATHGIPNQINAHPHFDSKKEIAVVHNGIIENFRGIRTHLETAGCRFRSETDSEVLPHLIDSFYKGDLLQAVQSALRQVEGNYAIAVISAKEPTRMVAARKGSPLVIGLGADEFFVASDVTAMLEHINEVVYIEDDEMVDITMDGVRISTLTGEPIQRASTTVSWDLSQVQKEGYPHFMIKEIMEQPSSLRQTINERIQTGRVVFPELEPLSKDLSNPDTVNQVVFLGCGTAYHAGFVGKYTIEKFARIPATVDMSSEFRYGAPVMTPGTLVVAISQSGETTDTLAAVRYAKEQGATTIAITNVVGSSITREVDVTINMYAGPEIAVAASKTYTSQLAVLSLFALYVAQLRRSSGIDTTEALLHDILHLPAQVEKVLTQAASIEHIAKRYSTYNHFLYLGRHINYPSALEGALKLKEISYIHAEGYPAGEMKHGAIALIDEEMPVVCIVSESEVHEKMLSNIQEVHARKGRII